jgi:hypothetical protein
MECDKRGIEQKRNIYEEGVVIFGSCITGLEPIRPGFN